MHLIRLRNLALSLIVALAIGQPGFCKPEDTKSTKKPVNINVQSDVLKYKSKIYKKLKDNWQKSDHNCRELYVGFRIDKNGAVKDLKIGNDRPNKQAEKDLDNTFKKSTPFGERPKILKDHEYAWLLVTWDKLKDYNISGPFFVKVIPDDIQETIGMKERDPYTEDMKEKLVKLMDSMKLKDSGKARVFVKLTEKGEIKDITVSTVSEEIGSKFKAKIKEQKFDKVPKRFRSNPVFACILDWDPKLRTAVVNYFDLTGLDQFAKNDKIAEAKYKDPKSTFGDKLRKKISDNLNRATTDGVRIHAVLLLNEDGSLNKAFVGGKKPQKKAEAELMKAIKKAAPFAKLPSQLKAKKYAWMVFDWEKEDPLYVVNGPFFRSTVSDDIKKTVGMN